MGYTGSVFSPDSGKSTFIDSQKFGIQVASETAFRKGELFAAFAFDYLLEHTDEKSVDSWLLGFAWGYCLAQFFQPYAGGSLGIKWEDYFSIENIGFAWKVTGGIRASFSTLCVRGSISYGTILGLSGTLAIGWQF